MRTNRFAMAALVAGILGLVVFGIGFGIAALVQTGRRTQKGRGLAIGAIAVSAVWLVAATAAALVFAATRPSPAVGRSALPHRDGTVMLASLKAGDCFTTDPEGVADSPFVYPSPCDHPHEGEVTAKATLPAGPYPGVQQLADRAEALCKERRPDTVRLAVAGDKDFQPRTDIPSEQDWTSGRRGVTCMYVFVGNSSLTTPIGGRKPLQGPGAPVKPGDCFTKWEDFGPGLVECTEKHKYQVLGFVRLDEGAWPGTKKLDVLATERCAEKAVDVWGTNPPFDLVDPYFVLPDKASWNAGDRHVVCLVGAKKGRSLKKPVVPVE